MKKLIIILSVFIFLIHAQLFAALSVIDVNSISTQLATARRDLAQQLLQEANQRTQILRMVEQIRQIDAYLKRFGDPRLVDLQTLRSVYDFTQELPLTKTTAELERLIYDNYLFAEQSVYQPISRNIEIDGQPVVGRDVSAYKPELVARRTFAHYHDVKERALSRRQAIDEQISQALVELDNAATASEVNKLQMVIATLNARRSEVSAEIDLAASEAATRYFQNEVESRIAARARYQDERVAFRQAVSKNLKTFRPFTSPVLFKK